MSMNPGATAIPAASIVESAFAVTRDPMATILPSRMPTSPEYQGEPVPSMMWPLRIIRSNCCCCAVSEVKNPARPKMQRRKRKRFPVGFNPAKQELQSRKHEKQTKTRKQTNAIVVLRAFVFFRASVIVLLLC
jgi:hypothetical protein